jgi:hypothetical protein
MTDQVAFWGQAAALRDVERDEPMADAVRRLADLRGRRDALDEEARVLAAQIRQRLGSGTHQLDADVSVIVVRPRRFDAKKAMLTIPDQYLDRCCVPAVDHELARKVLPQGVYEECLSDGGWQVRPRL